MLGKWFPLSVLWLSLIALARLGGAGLLLRVVLLIICLLLCSFLFVLVICYVLVMWLLVVDVICVFVCSMWSSSSYIMGIQMYFPKSGVSSWGTFHGTSGNCLCDYERESDYMLNTFQTTLTPNPEQLFFVISLSLYTYIYIYIYTHVHRYVYVSKQVDACICALQMLSSSGAGGLVTVHIWTHPYWNPLRIPPNILPVIYYIIIWCTRSQYIIL